MLMSEDPPNTMAHTAGAVQGHVDVRDYTAIINGLLNGWPVNCVVVEGMGTATPTWEPGFEPFDEISTLPAYSTADAQLSLAHVSAGLDARRDTWWRRAWRAFVDYLRSED